MKLMKPKKKFFKLRFYIYSIIKIRKFESQLEERNKEINQLNDKILKYSIEHNMYLNSDNNKHQDEIDILIEEKDSIIRNLEEEINVSSYY